MTPSDLRAWLAAMGYTNYRAAKAAARRTVRDRPAGSLRDQAAGGTGGVHHAHRAPAVIDSAAVAALNAYRARLRADGKLLKAMAVARCIEIVRALKII